MNDEQLQLRQMAIRERRKLLELLYSENGRQYEKTGLVSLARIIFIMAARHVKRPEWPGHVVEESVELCWELEWYDSYLSALAELVPPLQAAILNGEITPRGTLTRAPLDLERLRPWLELNPSAEISKTSKSHWEIALPDMQNEIVWPDIAVMPDVRIGVTIEDVSTWAKSKKIASPDELAALMQRGAQEPPLVPADMLKRVKDELMFDDEMRILYPSVRKDTAGNPYHVKGAKRWLKTVSEIGLITPRQFMALMLEGMRNTNGLMNGGLNESYELEIITAWAGFIREALKSGEISPRDDVTCLPIGKMGCAPHIDILDCLWCMSVSDGVKLAASKGAEIDLVAIADHLYKVYFEDEAAPLKQAAQGEYDQQGAKVEAVPATSPSGDDEPGNDETEEEQSEEIRRGMDGLPHLQVGPNPNMNQVVAWTVAYAHKVKVTGDDHKTLADKVRLEATRCGYKSARGDFTNHIIIGILKKHAKGITGGREKNGRKSKN